MSRTVEWLRKNRQRFFTATFNTVQSAIENAEKVTSAEINLVVLRHCWKNIKVKAAELFKQYKLYDTEQRNAVLILVVTTNREFLVYGDEGIHARVGQSFWEDTRELMQGYFRQDEFGRGLQEGIASIGEKLKAYYPGRDNDKNEITNDVAYEE